MKNRNWFWGIFFLLAAIFVVASQLGSFGEIGIISIGASLLLAALIIHSLINKNFFGVFVPMAFLYFIYQKPCSLADISPWLLISAAVLTSIGFSILFHTHPKKDMCCKNEFGQFSHTIDTVDDNNPYAKVSFSSSSKYLHADCLKSGQFISSFGALEVFFDQVQLDPSGAEIYIDCSFGAIKLYIPKHWRVIDKMNATLGGVDNNIRLSRPAEDAPTLTLTGNVSFGGIEIQYI